MLCSHCLKRFPRKFSVGINLACQLWAIRHRGVIACDGGCCVYARRAASQVPSAVAANSSIEFFAVRGDLQCALTGYGEIACKSYCRLRKASTRDERKLGALWGRTPFGQSFSYLDSPCFRPHR